MPNYKVISDIRRHDTWYQKGDVIELTEREANEMPWAIEHDSILQSHGPDILRPRPTVEVRKGGNKVDDQGSRPTV